MTLALLVLVSLGNSGSPLRPDLFETRLSAPQGVLLPELAGSRGGDIYGGVKQIVSGSICLVIGGAILAAGIYGLVAAGAQDVDPKAKTVFQVLGWTGVGFGGIVAIVGIPLLIVGIVRVSAKNDLGLAVGNDGSLIVRF